MSEVVRSELRGKVRWVTLDNPGKNNALDRPAMAALGEAFRTADADDETRVVVLSGAGRAFCAGADLVAAQSRYGKEKTRRQASRTAHRRTRSSTQRSARFGTAASL